MEKLKLINDIAVKNDIALVYIFGSRVKTGLDILKGAPEKNDDPLADIDIGVVFSSGLPSPGRRPERYSSIYNRLEEIFAPFPVDLVFNVLRRAADFRPFLERYLDEMLEEYLRK